VTDVDTTRLAIAGVYLMPALVWGSMAIVGTRLARRNTSGSALMPLVACAMVLLAVYYLLGLILALRADAVPGPSPDSPLALLVLRDLSVIAAVSLGGHITPLATIRGESPGWRKLAANYAAAAVTAALVSLVGLGTPAPLGWQRSRFILLAYVVVTHVLNLAQLHRLARADAWGPGGLGEPRRSDLRWHLGGSVVVLAVAGLLWWAAEQAPLALRIAGVEATIGLVAAVPFAVRFLTEGGRVFFSAVALLVATASLYLGVRALIPPGLQRDALTILGVVFVLGPGYVGLRRAIDRFLFHRSTRRRSQLQAIIDRLPPELGPVECCRRGLAEGIRVMQLTSAAILLHNGEAIVAGDFPLDTVRRVWPRGDAAEALPRQAFGGPDFRLLPLELREAMVEACVVGVLPIVSPRRRWGDLIASAPPMTSIYSDDDVQMWQGFAAQMGLVLDAADLIARAVDVERSLAHAEKLAAIGEVSTRIAHEIRNPVTAARSLAQQLAHEPGSPFAAEHALILAELERVERQVAALLRFARREEFRFEPVALGDLARATVAALRARLEGAGIALALELEPEVTARADREKMRQVLVNLIENAIDALRDVPDGRRLAVAVGGTNGRATISVTDNGPGVAPDVLPHLFEPFFTRKADGTGLGLAIAQRIVAAHGGTIEASGAPSAGLAMRVALPAAEENA
jgi:signal transduction histidine kinase